MSNAKCDGNSSVPERLLKILEPTEEEKGFRRKLYPDVSEVENAKILCTICQKDVKHVFLLKKKSYKHIFLQVAVCKGCLRFYEDGDFSVDEDGDDKYCRWCGQGGTLSLCSSCPSTFCKKCIRTNLERKHQLMVDKDDWKCFFCDPTPLYKMRALSWAIDEHFANIKKKEEAQKKKKKKEVSEKKKLPATPKPGATVLHIEKPEYPHFDISQMNIIDHVETMKYWMLDMCKMVNPMTSAPKWNHCKDTVRDMKTSGDFVAAKSAVENFIDHEIDELVRTRQMFIEGLVIFKDKCMASSTCEMAARKNGVDGNDLNVESEVVENPKARARRKALRVESDDEGGSAMTNGDVLNNTTIDDQNNSTVNVLNNSSVDMFESSIVAEEEEKDVNQDEDANQDKDAAVKEDSDKTRPVIRLRSLSDLMDPKLSKISSSAGKLEPSSDNKLKPSSASKPELTRKKSLELITLSSSDDDDVPVKAKKRSLKVSEAQRSAKPDKSNCLKKGKQNRPNVVLSDSDDEVQILETNVKQGDGTVTTSDRHDDETVQAKLFTSSESEGERWDQPKKNGDASGNGKTDEKKTADNLIQSCNEKKGEKEACKSEKVQESSTDENSESSSPKKNVETSKNEKEDIKSDDKNSDSSSDSTSSSDPLSGSSSEGRKTTSRKTTSPKKVNRSYFSETESEGGSKKKKVNEKSQKKNRVRSKQLFNSESDSDSDGKELLKKRKKISTSATKSSKSKKEPKELSKSRNDKTVEDSGDDSMDMDIEKLCDLKSLRPKRGRSSSSSSSMSSEDDAKDQKKASKKVKQDGDKLSDFYDSGDDQEREDGDVQEEDMESTFRREFPQYNDDTVLEEDIRASILNMSSSSEREPEPVSSEGEDPTAKNSKSESSKARKEGAKRERTKGRKKYADKLMDMNIDSDSDDMEKGEKKYEKLKEKRALKDEEKDSDEDTPIVKKKAVANKKGKPRKKMFSDSDESPIEDNSDEDKSDKESDDDDKKKKSASGSDSSEDKPKKPTKKRRRIRTGSDSSSGSDSEGGGKKDKSLNDASSKGRKSIRRILKEDDLKQTTQAALKSEQERKRRIAEKQKLYNAMVEKASEKHKELSELVLDFNPKTKEKIVVVDPTLVKKLKPHQAEGVKFMWDSCFESLEMTKKKNGSGCILAHCMGLGKSLQVVTLIHTLLTHPDIGVKTVLVVAPVSTVLNWANEFDKWLKDVGSGQDVNVFHMTRCQTNHRAFLLNDWSRQGGVLIMGYNLLRTLSNPKARIKAGFKKVFQEKLVDPGPDIVVCDEGHILKNEKTAISITMSKMKTRRRIVLTGTPLQNNLVEYHCMVQFVKPNLLGTKKEFTNRFVNPIQNGQFEDSTPHDVKIMKRRAHVLHTMLDGLVQRKDYNVLTPYLPPKYEYVIHLKLSDVQVKLYRYYLLNKVHGGDGEADGTAPKGKRLFVDFQNLMWICLHPRTLRMKSVKDDKKAEMEFDDTDEEGSLKEFIDDGSSSSSSDFKTSSSGSDDEKSGSEKEKSKPARRKTRGQGSVSDAEDEPAAPSKQWWSELIEEEQMDDIRQSSKLFLFFTILKYCEEIGDKLLIFSQSLYTLDLLEYFLDKIDEESQKPEDERIPGIKGFEGSWAKGLDYFRLDGSSACENRESWCKSFNRTDNVRARLFLISTRAGGLGINLTGANRVIIFDASWNPSFDVQSLFRVYRFGQEKPCYIYRFLSKGTMEEKIYERQVAKLSTSLRVIDEQQIDRHFSHSALAELYMFDPEGSELQGTPALPKDRLMAELLQNHSDIILSHHQHDSLLENQEDQGLSEEERKAAWAEFENEKNQKPPPIFQNANMMSTLVSMMMEIRTKLKIQNPSWTEDQLRMGALQILQQYPDFKSMAPYLNLLFQQQQLQQQQQQMKQQQMQGQQMRPGLPIMSNPQFPGMAFPSFQYPLYNNQQQQQVNNFAPLNNITAGRLQNAGQVNNVGQVQNALLEQLLKQNAATNLNSLLVNPKHAAQTSQQPSQLQTVRSLQKVQPPSDAKSKSTGAGTSTEPIELDDSGPIELNDD